MVQNLLAKYKKKSSVAVVSSISQTYLALYVSSTSGHIREVVEGGQIYLRVAIACRSFEKKINASSHRFIRFVQPIK